jgi:fucose permease
MLFSVGCGLLEVLLSPLVQAVPSRRKEADMSLLHAFAPIGKVVVILGTSLALHWGGVAMWPWVTAAWALVPLANTLAFAGLRLPPIGAGQRVPAAEQGAAATAAKRASAWVRQIRSVGLLLVAMLLAGAVEMTLAQWASAYVQTSLGYTPLVADLAGLGLFGVGVIAGRLWFGLREMQADLRDLLRRSAWAALLVCAMMGLCPWPSVALGACVLAGLAVSLLWPGLLSMASTRFPVGGPALFGALAAAGDAGAGLMSWSAGLLADGAPGGLRLSFLVLAGCALALIVVISQLRPIGVRPRAGADVGSTGLGLVPAQSAA